MSDTPTLAPAQLQESRHHKERNRVIINLAAQGWEKARIADYLGINVSVVSRVLKTRPVRIAVQRLQKKWFQDPALDRFKEILNDAINTSYQLMMDKRIKPEVRARVAGEIQDRVLGKATQQIDVESNTIRDLFKQMDDMRAKKALDVSETKDNTDTLEGLFSQEGDDDGEPEGIEAITSDSQ